MGCGALVVLFLCSYLLSGVVTKPVGAAWAQQEQFLSDASHELKTPLTVILSSAELLEQSASPEQAVYVDNIRAEGRRMKAWWRICSPSSAPRRTPAARRTPSPTCRRRR